VNTKARHEKLMDTEKTTEAYISNKHQLTKDLLNN